MGKISKKMRNAMMCYKLIFGPLAVLFNFLQSPKVMKCAIEDPCMGQTTNGTLHHHWKYARQLNGNTSKED